MVQVSEIFDFIENKTGVDKVSENIDITNELGVYGDDFFELIEEFSKKFNVDISSCLWYFHTREEGSIHSIGAAFFKSPNETVTHIPLTPLMLCEFAKDGKWNIQYPKHRIPKKRYDLLINQLLLLSFIIFLFYKCAS
jgi:hypothetical protein